MSSVVPYVAGAAEVLLVLTGTFLLWRFVLRPEARAAQPRPPLPEWEVALPDFFVFLFLVVTCSFLGAAGVGLVSRWAGLRGDAATVAAGAAAQLGMLAGALAHRGLVERREWFDQPPFSKRDFLSGGATFLISLPLLIGVANLWEFVLVRVGLPVSRQDLIAMFANAESPWLLAAMIFLAVVVAPLAEELVFRAGLFRYLRTRVPRLVALLLPALIFATLHINWSNLQGLSSLAPLIALAVVFSLAYERTGRIGTCVVAHALFNLNTILVILTGISA